MAKFPPLQSHYVLDLETCDGEHIEWEPYARQRVWYGGYMNIRTAKPHFFTNLRELLEDLFKHGANQNIYVAIHNLSFDGTFIVPELFKMGFEVSDGMPEVGEFSALIDDRNNWYTVQVRLTKRKRVTFWCTAKLFPMKLKDLPNLYNTPTQKIAEDSDFYNAVRDVDHIPTAEEVAYLYNDLKVLQEVLIEHIKLEGLGFKKTQASQAFYNFTKHFKAWKLRFPPLEEDLDQEIRKAYWGGISYVNPLHAHKAIKNVYGIDINSSYPYQIAEHKLPYGKMILELGREEHPYMAHFWVARAVVKFKLKEHKHPCIAKKGLINNLDFDSSEKWLTDSRGLVELVFSSIDYETFLTSYDFEVVEWIYSKHWKQKKHKELKEYVDVNNKDKVHFRDLAQRESDSALKTEYLAKAQRAKINNNSFYGKFGEDILKIGKVPFMDDHENVTYNKDRIELLKKSKRKFLPLAIATTAYGRRQLVDMMNYLGDDFIYCDTDSAYFTSYGFNTFNNLIENNLIEYDSLKLGAWAMEGEYDYIKALRPKTYITVVGDKVNTTVAGLPKQDKPKYPITLDNFKEGLIIPDGNGKLMSHLTPTGKKLIPTSFEIGRSIYFNF